MKRAYLSLIALIAISCGNIAISPVEHALQSVVHMTGTPLVQGAPVSTNSDADTMVWKQAEGRSYGCTAWAIDVRKFVTAAHCIGDNMMIDGHPAFVIKQDATLDLAVIVADYVVPALTIREAPLTREESAIGLGYGFSWKFPTITHHKVMMLDYTPLPNDIPTPGTWFSFGFIGGMSGGPVIDDNGQVVGLVQRGSDVVGYGVSSATIFAFLATLQQ